MRRMRRKKVIYTLMNNCYPLPFIFETINRRLRMLTYKLVEGGDKEFQRSQTNQKSFFTIPYVRSISESFLPITKKFGFDISYSVSNTLNKFIKRGKDKIDLMSQTDCVYRIDCSDCDMTYVGQTKRKLGTRVKEYKSDINKKNGLLSVVSNHRLEYNHEMKWSEITILENRPLQKE